MITLAVTQSFGQNDFSNIRVKKIPTNDSIKIDSLSIIPGSLQIKALDTLFYKIDDFKSQLYFKNAPIDSVTIVYKVFPINFSSSVQNRFPSDSTSRKGKLLTRNPYKYNSSEITRGDLFGESSLKKGGSISRGINIGTNRDLSLNSNLNLQLSGTFQGVEILAAVTDNNIPIQPQGNTQTLQEFDKVFVQFSKDGQKIIAGDFQTVQNEDQFLKFNKKAQGLSYEGLYETKLFGKKAEYQVKADAALSRGKFSRNSIIGIEGNQGPYKLVGTENERFIIILSGTERVYIDGKLLQRGMDGDYTIDYNSAELTFTTNQIITKDKRIVVEFQYSDQNYSRSLFNASNVIKNEKGGFFVNFYSEQDMKFQQLQQILTEEQKTLLINVGDSLQNAISLIIDTVEYTTSQVLYKPQDTTISSTPYTYYEYSTDPDSAIYYLGFSNVGTGNGYYILSNTTSANGRVYEWIPPIDGVPQGDYEPLIQLMAPKQQQMLTIGTNYNLNKKTELFFETAFSNQNQNLFSKQHKEDDQGIALKTHLKNTKYFKGKSKDSLAPLYKSQHQISYQIINKKFKSIERFRDVEFTRDFNLANTSAKNTEQILGWNWNYALNNKKIAGVNVSYLDRKTEYYGLKSGANLNTKLWESAKFTGTGSFLNSEGSTIGSSFLRHQISITQQIKKGLSLKIWEEEENNQTVNIIPDTLSPTSFRYTVYGSELAIKKSEKITFKVNWNQRTDYTPFNNELNKITTANNAGANFQFGNKKGTKFLWNSTYRELEINNSELVSQDPENTFLNRIDYKFKLWKGMLQSNSFFEIASGSELKRQYQYVEVNPGQGQYTWLDSDNDSIQDINEFQIAQFSDQANFVRVFLPTTDFIKTYNNKFNQSFNLSPAKFYKRDTKTKKLLTRFNNQFIMKLDQKISKDQEQRFQVPFQNSIADTSLISISSSVRNTMYFNRSNPTFGTNYSFRQNQSKSVLTSGFEARELKAHSINLRWNLLKKFTLKNTAELNQKSRISQYFDEQNYQIDSYVMEPKLSYQKGSSFRTTVSGALKNKLNSKSLGGEKATFNKLGIELTYNMLTKGRTSASFDYIATTFSGDENNTSPLLFDMLEGFQIGTNYTWQTRYQRAYKNNLQLTFMYEGRASETAKIVHTGNMQVQLLF